MKKAFLRNRVRRLLKEAYRLNKSGLIDSVKAASVQFEVIFSLNITDGFDKIKFSDLSEDMHKILNELIRKIPKLVN
ncbi:MAG: ribonuclease P protein component [Ignavibacteria bacterium]|nr:ribonuclease P protein component [Ignavibacteria bacterium]